MTTQFLKIGHGGLTILSYVLVFGCLAGCGGAFVVGGVRGGGGGSDSDNGGGGGGDTADDEIGIRFVNTSDLDVDTQFFATNDVLENPREDLFQPEYRVQSSIGVAGTGIVQAGSDDEITFPCTENTFLGTQGGEFLDPDRGTLIAEGQSRFARVGDNFDCGNVVIFGYTEEGGEYDSTPPIPDFRD